MEKRLLISALVVGILALAAGGWTVQALRWGLTGRWLQRLRPATA